MKVEFTIVRKCPDNCGLIRERWERMRLRNRFYYRCSRCKRFVGWIKKVPKEATMISITDFGAIPDSRLVDNSKAINLALTAAMYQPTGETVWIPEGRGTATRRSCRRAGRTPGRLPFVETAGVVFSTFENQPSVLVFVMTDVEPTDRRIRTMPIFASVEPIADRDEARLSVRGFLSRAFL